MTLATAVREHTVPPRFPLLRQAQLALATAANDVVSDETNLIVDSIDTMAELLEKERTSPQGAPALNIDVARVPQAF